MRAKRLALCCLLFSVITIGINSWLSNHPAIGWKGLSLPFLVHTKDAQMREGLRTLNDEEVVFYGQVLDQFNAPVAGALVKADIQVNNGIRLGQDTLVLQTDANGLFTIGGHKGKSLGISVSKLGFIMATTNTFFFYSLLWPESKRHFPDPNKPTLVRMRKLQGTEPLVKFEKTFQIAYAEGSLFFDLVTGEVTKFGGDLEVIVKRAPGEFTKRNPGDWSIELRAVNGGIIPMEFAAFRVLYEAPVDGYQANYLKEMDHNNPRYWYSSTDGCFVLKSRNGHVFSKFCLEFGINEKTSGKLHFEFRGVANANGSRSFEGYEY